MTTTTVPFWLDDPSVLIKQDLHHFFPSNNMSPNERFNSIVRLGLYSSILAGFLTKQSNSVKYLVVALILSYVLHKGHQASEKAAAQNNAVPAGTYAVGDSDSLVAAPPPVSPAPAPALAPTSTTQAIETLENTTDNCQRPTANNPFMNATYVDHLDNPNRPEACNINDPDIKKEADDLFNNGLYRDVSDNMGKIHAQRQFFTMPYTTFPNNQEEFAKWLYYTEDNCKQNPDNCVQYEDLRGKRFILPNPYENPVVEAKSSTV